MTRSSGPRVPRQSRRTEVCAMPLELQAVVCPGFTVAVAARLRYQLSEPYAVYLDSHTDLDEPITWMFGRDLLAAGVHEWAGVGDVSIYPGTGDSSETVFIALSGEATTVVLRAPAPLVRGFLRRTERMVPYGAEPGHLDLDGLLRRLQEPQDRPSDPGP